MRVVLIDKNKSKELKYVREDLLAERPGWVVVRMTDFDIVEHSRTGRPPVILYLDQQDFEDAMEGLTGSEQAEAIVFRRDHASVEDMRMQLQDRHEAAFRLALEVAASDSVFGPKGITVGIALLRRMAFLVSPERFQGTTIDILRSLQEGEYRTAGQIDWCLKRYGIGTDLPVAAVEKLRDSFGTLATSIDSFRLEAHDPSVSGLPVISPLPHAYFISPYDTVLVRGLTAAGIPHVRWKDGVVAGITETDARRQQMLNGKEVVLVWPRAAEFMSKYTGLTGPQFNQTVSERFNNATIGCMECINGYLADILFQLSTRLVRADILKRHDPALLATVLENSVEPAFAALAAVVGYSQDGSRSVNSSMAKLALIQKDMVNVASLAAALLPQSGNNDEAVRMREFAAMVDRDIVEFKKIIGR